MGMNDWIKKTLEEQGLDCAIERVVAAYDYVSFPELERRFGEFTQVEGNYTLGFSDKNIVIWPELSEAFVDAILKLRTEDRVRYFQADLLTYVADGGILKLPIARRDRCYKKPHWMPTVLRPGPNTRPYPSL